MPTLAAATRMRLATEIIVLDDGHRPWLAGMCDELGIEYRTRIRRDGRHGRPAERRPAHARHGLRRRPRPPTRSPTATSSAARWPTSTTRRWPSCRRRSTSTTRTPSSTSPAAASASPSRTCSSASWAPAATTWMPPSGTAAAPSCAARRWSSVGGVATGTRRRRHRHHDRACTAPAGARIHHDEVLARGLGAADAAEYAHRRARRVRRRHAGAAPGRASCVRRGPDPRPADQLPVRPHRRAGRLATLGYLLVPAARPAARAHPGRRPGRRFRRPVPPRLRCAPDRPPHARPRPGARRRPDRVRHHPDGRHPARHVRAGDRPARRRPQPDRDARRVPACSGAHRALNAARPRLGASRAVVGLVTARVPLRRHRGGAAVWSIGNLVCPRPRRRPASAARTSAATVARPTASRSRATSSSTAIGSMCSTCR